MKKGSLHTPGSDCSTTSTAGAGPITRRVWCLSSGLRVNQITTVKERSVSLQLLRESGLISLVPVKDILCVIMVRIMHNHSLLMVINSVYA